ncbi:mechanosensitive ion channel, partial [Candidatus Saccharibacteria bacterium]|nr:mechanosensitive ion channel [Candidatus Saccharibacteria bacterium]
LKKDIAACRYIRYRAQVLIKHNRDRLQSITTAEVMSPTTRLWDLVTQHRAMQPTSFSTDLLLTRSGLAHLTVSKIVSLLASLVGLFLFSRTLRRLFEKAMEALYLKEHSYLLVLMSVLKRWSFPLLSAGALMLFTRYALNHVNDHPGLTLLSYAGLLLISTLTVFDYLLSLAHSFFKQEEDKASALDAIYFHTKLVAILVFLGYSVSVLMRDQALPNALVELANTLFFATVTPFVVLIFWHSFRLLPSTRFNGTTKQLTKITFGAYLVVMYSSLIFGYLNLAIYLTEAILLTGIVLALFISLFVGLLSLRHTINDSTTAVSRRLKSLLGIRLHRHIKEIDLITFTTLTLLCGVTLLALLWVWRVSENVSNTVIDSYFDGIHIAGLFINFYRITIGLYLFSGLNLISRFLANLTTHAEQSKDDMQTQDAIASLLVYVGFSISLIIALVASGVNFTGLAIAAGALSVVIALGLQDIVTNFVSGLILLTERPIKAGDRILVGETEGYVKKVRIRATQITTLAQ